MKWLINLLQKPRTTGILAITVLLLLYWLVFYVPTAIQMRKTIADYTDFFDDSYPALTLNRNQVTITGTMPFIRSYKDNTWAIFDTTGTIQKLPENAANGSFFITQDSVHFRFKSQLRSFPLKEINVDNLVLAPPKIRKIIAWLKGPFAFSLGLIGFILLWSAAWVVTVVGSGIIFMIDVFSNGKLASNQIPNLALLSLVPVWLMMLMKAIFSFPLFKPLLILLFIYLATLIILTFYTEKTLGRETDTTEANPFNF